MSSCIKMNDKKKIYYTVDEWQAEGERRFGKDLKNWRFKCPACGNVASGKEFFEVGEDPNAMYCECIGRHVAGKGCNWAAYGLFDICVVHVDGKPVFEFGEEDKKGADD